MRNQCQAKNKQTITNGLDRMYILIFFLNNNQHILTNLICSLTRLNVAYFITKYHRQSSFVFPCLSEPWHSTSSTLLQNTVNVFLSFLLMHSSVYVSHQYNQEVRIRTDSHMSYQTNGKTAALEYCQLVNESAVTGKYIKLYVHRW